MRVRMKVRFLVTATMFIAASTHLACSSWNPDAFQPATYGAKPWDPPPGWNPQPACSTGYYVAIETCSGCTEISYALCVGDKFTQCVCGRPFTPGAMCPQTFACSLNDFPPQGWMEFIAYAGPGWAGLTSRKSDAGAP
jgi:hypothetical protein